MTHFLKNIFHHSLKIHLTFLLECWWYFCGYKAHVYRSTAIQTRMTALCCASAPRSSACVEYSNFMNLYCTLCKFHSNLPVFDKRSPHKANNVTRQELFQKVLLKDRLLGHLKLVKLSNISAVNLWIICQKLNNSAVKFSYLWMYKWCISPAVDNNYDHKIGSYDCYC